MTPEMRANRAILRLSQLLPRDVRASILNILTRDRSPVELARSLGYPLDTVERWLRGNCPDDEETSRILFLALRRSDETMGILTKFFDEVKLLFEQLNLTERRGKMGLLLEGLDERSRRIIQYLTVKRHAGIRELADLIEAPSDMDVLIRLKKVINPKAEEIFGETLVNFERLKIDPLTGEKVPFSWWLSESLIEGLSHDDVLLDIFDEGNNLKVVAHLPTKDRKDIEVKTKDNFLIISAKGYYEEVPLFIPVEGIAEETYNHGVLEVKLKKAG